MDLDFQSIHRVFVAVGKLARIFASLGGVCAKDFADLRNQTVHYRLHHDVVEFNFPGFVGDFNQFHRFEW